MSEDTSLGEQPDLAQCANKCLTTTGCQFFIFGRGFKHGRCYWEHTNSSSCSEGWELDEYDFYSIRCGADRASCIYGCTEPRALNFDPSANVEDGSCIAQTGCAAEPCTKCDREQRTGKCGDEEPYRSFRYDAVEASRVADGALVMDGDLSDWGVQRLHGGRGYKDVPFAKLDRTEVVFETSGQGKYFGESDFSIEWMLSWDSDYLYLAAKVTDDTLQTSSTCYENGLQVAFEVGGPAQGERAGMLQAERSSDLEVSRLELINMALGAEQHACSTEGVGTRICCVHYELSQQVGGFFRRTKLAVLRNPMARTTTYEAAFHKSDLLGGDEGHLRQWNDGLRFGFSFVLNDGDNEARQNGWAGYYPHAIVQGWNGGQKEPHKAGTVHLAGPDPASASDGSGGGSGGGGGGAGLFFLGIFLTLLTIGLAYVFVVWREGGVSAVKRLLKLDQLRARPRPSPSMATVLGGPLSSASTTGAGYSSYNPPA